MRVQDERVNVRTEDAGKKRQMNNLARRRIAGAPVMIYRVPSVGGASTYLNKQEAQDDKQGRIGVYPERKGKAEHGD